VELGATSSIARVHVRGIHHLGVAVADLDEAIATYEQLFGARLERRDSLDAQGVNAASLLLGESRVELVAPTGEDTYVGRFLAKRGPGMHHLALETDDVEATIRDLAASGAQLIDDVPRRGLFGLEVAFVHPNAVHGVLTEVVSNG
jgi:methylmalonyl-CoA/ethylmalonyl-CoA epimerase